MIELDAATWTPEEMMTVAAARKFRDRAVCFVGVGLPSVAACLARELHAPAMTLVYESGAIGAKPFAPPLSIADSELAETADFLVSVPEIFSYWLQGGRINIGFLGAAQIDRFGNLNSTVIGNYDAPKVRLPGAGGAPHISSNVREIVVIARHTPKTFVAQLDFLTTPHTTGSTTIVTDLGILESCGPAGELVLTSRYEGVSVERILQATGWPLLVSANVAEVPPPTTAELSALRALNVRAELA